MLLYILIVCAGFIGSIFNIPISIPTGTGINYELLGGGFEGDMILPDGFDPTNDADGKGVAIFGARQWPNNIIPYDLSSITNAAHRTLIEQAVNILMDVTGTPIEGSTATKRCLTFRPKTSSDRVFVKIQYGTGCSASVGYSSSERRMTLQDPGCFHSGTIQHEFLHILGFDHEQSRPDRDSYITVNYANIEEGEEHQFDKYVWGTFVSNQNTPYDLGSIMHYGAYYFSKNGQPTITPTQTGSTIGQRDKLSATDIAEIRAFYKCSS